MAAENLTHPTLTDSASGGPGKIAVLSSLTLPVHHPPVLFYLFLSSLYPSFVSFFFLSSFFFCLFFSPPSLFFPIHVL
jgi:hypothetical protein